jgi:fluoroquinolone resistance protein
MKGANFLKASCANIITQRSYFCSVYITSCDLSYTNFQGQNIEKCELYENKWTGANLVGASLQGSDLSRGVFSPDSWGDFNIQDCDLTNSELYGLDPRRVNLSGVKIFDWQQEHLLDSFGIVVVPG